MSSFSTNTIVVKADLIDHVLYFALRREEAEAATHPLHGLQGDLPPELLPGSCPAPRLQLHQAEVVLQLRVQLPPLLLQQAWQYGSLVTPALFSQGVLHTASNILRDSVSRRISFEGPDDYITNELYFLFVSFFPLVSRVLFNPIILVINCLFLYFMNYRQSS